jgi:putative sigma-54 modulation protein
MMEVLIRNAEGNLSEDDRGYASLKLGRLDRFFNKASKVELVHREFTRAGKQNHKVEVTIFADGLTIRGEELDTSIRAAIDLVGEKLENRLRRIKKRMVDKYRHHGNDVPAGFVEESQEPEADEHIVIKEHRHFLVKPMSADEAALEMELLGYPFFVFKNEANHKVEVLYRVKEGVYGLLHPEE